MTLKELVMKVEFDNLRPYLEKFEPEHLDNIYAFREAYDILRRMTPAKNGQHEIHVSWSGGEMEGEKKWISVHPMHEVSWEEDLAADVVVADDVHLTDEELAMHCLWEITYWGFSPEEQLETFERKFNHHKLVNKYEVALDKLEESIWKHQTPRRLRCRGENGERYTTQQSTRYLFNERKNRSKRKREYRQDKREEYLKRMAARENLITQLSAEGSSFKRSDVDFLLHIEYGRQYDYLSITSGTDGRLDYILESITKYQYLTLEKYNNAIVFIMVPTCYPLTKPELNRFNEAIRLHLGYDDILFGTSACESSRQDVKVTLLLNHRLLAQVSNNK